MVKLVLNREDSAKLVQEINKEENTEFYISDIDGLSTRIKKFYLPNGFGIKLWKNSDSRISFSLYKINETNES